jgi:hypothetical protein
LQLSLPDLFAYPSGVPLPYELRIILQSPLHNTSHVIAAELPEAPTNPAHLQLQLIRRLDVEADLMKAYVCSSRQLGGFGSTSNRVPVRVKVAAPVFVPSTSGSASGSWQRVVRYEGIATLADTPSFSSPTISVSHLIHLHVPILNTTVALAADWDVTISSGMEAMPPLFDFGSANLID